MLPHSPCDVHCAARRPVGLKCGRGGLEDDGSHVSHLGLAFECDDVIRRAHVTRKQEKQATASRGHRWVAPSSEETKRSRLPHREVPGGLLRAPFERERWGNAAHQWPRADSRLRRVFFWLAGIGVDRVSSNWRLLVLPPGLPARINHRSKPRSTPWIEAVSVFSRAFGGLQNAMTSSRERMSAEAESYRIERALMDCVAPPFYPF